MASEYVYLYGTMLEDLVERLGTHSEDPLELILRSEEEEEQEHRDSLPLNTHKPIRKNSKVIRITRRKKHMSLSELELIVDQSLPLTPIFEGASHFKTALHRSLAWAGVTGAIDSMRSIHRVTSILDESQKGRTPEEIEEFKASEDYELLTKQIVEAENRYNDGIDMYAYYVSKMPETQRRLELPNGVVISVIPIELVATLSQASFDDIEKEIDFEDETVQYVQKKLKKSKALMKMAKKLKNERTKASREERARYVRSIKDTLIKDMTDALNRKNDGAFDIDEVLYRKGLRSIEKKVSGEIVKGISYMMGDSSPEVSLNAMGNDPILESILENVKIKLRAFVEDEERSTPAIKNEDGEVVMS